MALREEVKNAIMASKGMSDEYRRQLMEVLQQAPDDFQGGWLRQSDYDKKMNEWKAKEVQPFQEQKTKWLEWYNSEAKPLFESYSQDIEVRDSRIAELESRIETGNYNPADENSMLTELQTLKQQVQTLPQQLEGRYITQEQLAQQSQATLDAWANGLLTLSDLQEEYRESYGKRFDRNAFIGFMRDNGMTDFRQAYDSFTGEERRAAWEKQKEAEIEAKFRTSNPPLASSGGVGTYAVHNSSNVGPVMARMAGVPPASEMALPPEASTRDAAMAAAEALRREGKY